MLKTTILATSALLAGLTFGYLSADGVPDTQVRTVTKEVPVQVEKRVEVPGPVRWKTRTEVRTKKVYSTPSACLAAINAAEEIQRQAGVFARTSAQYPPLVAEAYEAGVLQDAGRAKEIAARMQGLTGKIEGLTMDEAHEVFTVAASTCRSF